MTTNNPFNYCLVASCTDVGCKRSENEDSMGWRDTVNGRVVVVCDGMGGHVGGATASKIAVETILDYLDSEHISDPQEAMGMAIDRANQAVLQFANSHPELAGMGSTCVLLLVRDGLVYIAHVGDSRIYLVRNHMITQLTKDHSFVQMLVDAGQISPEEAEHHPRKNEITNALGLPSMTPATIKDDAIVPEAGDCFLLCSDGLSGLVSAKQMEKVISDHSIRAQQRAQILIDKARENGGPDNITAQLVEFVMNPAVQSKCPAFLQKYWKYLCAALVCVIGIVVGLVLMLPKTPKQDGIVEDTTAVNTPTTDSLAVADSTQATGTETNPILASNEPSLIEMTSTPQQSKKQVEKKSVLLDVNEEVILEVEGYALKKITIGKFSQIFEGARYTVNGLNFKTTIRNNIVVSEWKNTGDNNFVTASINVEMPNKDICYTILVKKKTASNDTTTNQPVAPQEKAKPNVKPLDNDSAPKSNAEGNGTVAPPDSSNNSDTPATAPRNRGSRPRNNKPQQK